VCFYKVLWIIYYSLLDYTRTSNLKPCWHKYICNYIINTLVVGLLINNIDPLYSVHILHKQKMPSGIGGHFINTLNNAFETRPTEEPV